MLADVLKAKLREAAPANALERDNVLQELLQHIILASFSRAGFFNDAAFHGGTCLKIVNGINRFSEDLDFLLKKPGAAFRWQPLLSGVQKDCEREGLAFEIQDKARADSAVQKAFLKNDSIGKILTIEAPVTRGTPKKYRVKLEIDTNPPAGSAFETKYITFPTVAPLTTQTLGSSFALKLHALLCRQYTKGRDWFDFIWYVSRKTPVNFPLLNNALRQQGPWAGTKIEMTAAALRDALKTSIAKIDWAVARQDVQRFLPLAEQESLRFWNTDFFAQLADKM
jgi:predicted nucleotidyltransferase component of viral defense system